MLVAATCLVTNWNAQEKSDVLYMTGSANCENGTLHYQIWDEENDEFIISGQTYIRGFSFQDYADAPYTKPGMTLKYVIYPD